MANKQNTAILQLSPNDAAIKRVQMLEYFERLARSEKAQALSGTITAGAASFEYQLLSTADVFTWRSDILQASFDASRQLPSVTLTPDLLPCASGLFLFPSPMRIDGVRVDIYGIGFLCSDALPDYISVWLYETRGSLLGAYTMFMLKFGVDSSSDSITDLRKMQKEKDVEAATMARASSSFLMASFLWLKQRVLLAEKPLLTGPAAKHSRKLGLSDSINVVVLRRPQEHVVQQSEHVDTEWSCQWFVRGHWRQQFLPSTQTHRPTWIEPYVKGPEDKPLKTPTPTVFSVSR